MERLRVVDARFVFFRSQLDPLPGDDLVHPSI